MWPKFVLIMQNPRITQEEIEIIKKAQAGDKSAFRTLFNKYKTFIENILNQYIKDSDEARDIANVVFLKVYNKLSKFKTYDSFGGWLRTVASRTAIDYLRETNRKFEAFDGESNRQLLSISDDSSETELVNQLSYNQLLDEFNKLPEQTRDICLLFYKDGLTVKQISDALDVPEGTIKSILHRTRKKLQKTIKN